MFVSQQQTDHARAADLYAFLLVHHPDSFRRVGNSICLKSNKSLSIKAGYNGYRDFATGETGNSIDFLVNHLGYTFQDAVIALSGNYLPPARPPLPPSRQPTQAQWKRPIALPVPAPLPHSRMYAYLMKRGIPKPIIIRMVQDGLVYQSAEKGNIVFVNKERDYCELRGSYTYAAKPFHGCRKTTCDRFWYILTGDGKPETAYITEAAIDAISLMLLRHNQENAAYISIGGVANDATISRIKRQIPTVLAVDNDQAGEACRLRHPDLPSIVPEHKDWNEDLLALRLGGHNSP